MLKLGCRSGGSTLSTVGVRRLPTTPLGRSKAPTFAGGSLSKSRNAASGSAGGLVNADGSVGGGGSVLSRGTAWGWDKPNPRMIAAAEILSASLVLDNGLVFSLAASSFIANTSDGSSERVAIHGQRALYLCFHCYLQVIVDLDLWSNAISGTEGR